MTTDKISPQGRIVGSILIATEAICVDDFQDGEIRCLSLLPQLTKPKKKNSIRLKNSQPQQGDYGINKKRQLFVFVNNEWSNL